MDASGGPDVCAASKHLDFSVQNEYYIFLDRLVIRYIVASTAPAYFSKGPVGYGQAAFGRDSSNGFEFARYNRIRPGNQ